jgi:hypothetical protein
MKIYLRQIPPGEKAVMKLTRAQPAFQFTKNSPVQKRHAAVTLPVLVVRGFVI